MRTILIASILLFTAFTSPLEAQRRGAAPVRGSVSFAIAIADPSGAPVRDVKVSVSGAAARTTRAQSGRAVFEGLPAGAYLFRFEKAGYTILERDVIGRAGKPIDVKVSLTPLSPLAVAPPPVDAKFVVLDMPAFIEKHYVGRDSGKTTSLGCATGGTGTLLQINDPVPQHSHDDADEFIYVIAGKGTLLLADRVEELGPAVFLMIPRRMTHMLAADRKKPLVIMSVRTGESCSGGITAVPTSGPPAR